jgi:hypothetical protein
MKMPAALMVLSCMVESLIFIKVGNNGINPFVKIGSIPLVLLKLVLPSIPTPRINSATTSNATTSVCLIRFLSKVRVRVGREVLLVMS